MKVKIGVVSLRFSPAHTAHLCAYRELLTRIADEVVVFLNPSYEQFIGADRKIIYTTDIQKILQQELDAILIYNVSFKVLLLVYACKKKGIKTLYVLHEPKRVALRELPSLEGRHFAMYALAEIFNYLICRKCDKILLASETGRKNYEKYMRRCNDCFDVFPLVYIDEYKSGRLLPRKYFSYIGGWYRSHAWKEFLQFAQYALKKDKNIRFLIATKDNISQYLNFPLFREAMGSGRLVVQAGRSMTIEEINNFYSQSLCVWNAYKVSTQSGVFANALMQGTPVIVNQNGVAKEVMQDRTAGVFVDMPHDNQQILQAYHYIKDHLSEMSANARKLFLEKYYYASNIELARKVILS